MDWKEIKVFAAHRDIENVSAALIAAGAAGLVINDPEDIREFAAEKTSSWDYIDDELLKTAASGEAYVALYISDDEEGSALAESVGEALERLKTLGIEYRVEGESVREEDWANEWKKYFKPLPIGEKLLIKPSWEPVPPGCERKIIELDPENSFGTGRHHTTQLCLELLEKYLNKGNRVADLGCGSGIIFISAMALGAGSAVGVDISSDAAKISRQNARKNGVSDEKAEIYCGDCVSDPELRKKVCKEYDLVAANIVADVLLYMKELFAEITKPAGYLVLSGIIDDRLDEVLEAVKSQGFTLIEQKHRDIWNAAVFKKQ